MRLGVSGGGASLERTVDQAVEVERDGVTSLWYPGAMLGDPLIGMAMAGRATTAVELGTAVLMTYTCHPVLMASRMAALAAAVGRPVTLGLGPSHQPAVERSLGLSYEHAGRHTEEYVAIVTALLRGEAVEHDGEDFRVRAAGPAGGAPVSVLVAALAPRLLRVAGELADGTVLWMANARAIDDHVAPRIGAAAAAAGRPQPRIVCGLPVAVHDDVAEARAVAAEQWAIYGTLPNYQRIMAHGRIASPAEAVLVGDETAVTTQIESLFSAGATDVWLAPFPVGADRAGSRARTRALVRELAGGPAGG